MSEQRYCVDCRWYKDLAGYGSRPDRRCQREQKVDLVTGEMYAEIRMAAVERMSLTDPARKKLPLTDGDVCGPEGKYWEPREAPYYANTFQRVPVRTADDYCKLVVPKPKLAWWRRWFA